MRPLLAAPFALFTLLACVLPVPAQAGSLRYCDGGAPLSAEQNDRMLRVAGVVKAELEKSGARVALVARSGLDLGFFDMRYSHAGLSLKAGQETAWSVRQLYFSCDERRPRIFDQGLSAFLMGMQQPERGFLSVVLLPGGDEAALEQAALDNRLALRLLGDTYSANAHAFATRYQNCNQWVAELLAAAWGAPLGDAASADASTRAPAQAWLRDNGFEPTVMDVGWRVLMWGANLIPWVHSNDHPADDLDAKRFRIVMPAALESFVQRRVPTAQRLEFCHTDRHVVVRRGWSMLPDACEAGPGDEVISLAD